MKFLITFLYLLVATVILYLGVKLTKAASEMVKHSERSTFRLTLISYLSLLCWFVQFWLLTGMFPVYLIVALLLASFLASGLNILFGSIAGFGIPDKQQKIVLIGLLEEVLHFHISKYIVTVLLSSLGLLTAWIGALWIYWSHTPLSSEATVYIALFQFTVLQIVTIPVQIAFTWPIMTSAYYDDDFRNAKLSSGFASIIYSTIYLLFPIWLFNEDSNATLKWSQQLPLPFWLLLSIPILLFIVGTLFPFFVGMYRYRSQLRAMIEWRTKWLSEVKQIFNYPDALQREEAFEEKKQAIKEEIERQGSSNETIESYFKFIRQTSEGNNELLPDMQVMPQEGPSPTTEVIPLPNRGADLIRNAREYLRHPFKGRAPVQVRGSSAKVIEVIRENLDRLVEWDLHISNLDKLLTLYKTLLESKIEQIGTFIEAQLQNAEKELSSITKKRNILAGSFLSVACTVIVWLFKTFQEEITGLVRTLVMK